MGSFGSSLPATWLDRVSLAAAIIAFAGILAALYYGEWKLAIKVRALLMARLARQDAMTCPQCGSPADVDELAELVCERGHQME